MKRFLEQATFSILLFQITIWHSSYIFAATIFFFKKKR